MKMLNGVIDSLFFFFFCRCVAVFFPPFLHILYFKTYFRNFSVAFNFIFNSYFFFAVDETSSLFAHELNTPG